jgi:hypothetical protein
MQLDEMIEIYVSSCNGSGPAKCILRFKEWKSRCDMHMDVCGVEIT